MVAALAGVAASEISGNEVNASAMATAESRFPRPISNLQLE
jgi:hypothetical protein